MQPQLTHGLKRRLMYVENKDGKLDGADARVGWVTFSRFGQSVHYGGRTLTKAKGQDVRDKFRDTETGGEFWVSGVTRRGSNTHPAMVTDVPIDNDALAEYRVLRSKT